MTTLMLFWQPPIFSEIIVLRQVFSLVFLPLLLRFFPVLFNSVEGNFQNKSYSILLPHVI